MIEHLVVGQLLPRALEMRKHMRSDIVRHVSSYLDMTLGKPNLSLLCKRHRGFRGQKLKTQQVTILVSRRLED